MVLLWLLVPIAPDTLALVRYAGSIENRDDTAMLIYTGIKSGTPTHTYAI